MNSKVQSLDTVAITILANDADITSCNIQGNFGIGILASGSRVRIEGNTFHLTQGGDNSAITATACTGLTVSSNMISGISQTGYGITIDTSTDARVAGNTVLELHNGIIGRNSPGISVTGSKATDCLYGLLIESCNGASVSGNDFGGTSSIAGIAITCNSSADAHISENDIVHHSFGIVPSFDDNLRITKNVITNTNTSIFAGNCKNVEVTDNDLSGGTGFGIGVQNGYGTVSQNRISGIGNQGIIVANAIPSIRISNNDLKNCGLVGNSPQAVIYQNSPSASAIEIIDNTYSGNTQNLQYYIWDLQASPPSVVTGNKNNTLLPNRIGT
jgi:nitrous oxidase accessory protein NosD